MQDQQPKSLGKYQIKKKIGAGGMGSVYLAVDQDLNRTVALKVLPREKAENPTLVKRFRAEAQAAAQLRHDNIVTVYEAGEIDGYLYIALEYVEGIDVYELICKRGIVPVKRSVEIIKQVTSALQHAGTMGIVHRDIKPSNLLIRRDGVCKLTDLGLARSIDETTETAITRAGTTVGTVDYMSPEQARDSKSADIRSDIYSLGCTWFHMLAGRPPFPEGSVTNKLHAHAVKPPPSPRDDNPSVPEGIVAVMQRMMAKKQSDRYQSPTELLQDLDRATLTHTAVSTDVLAGLAADDDFDEPGQPVASSGGSVTRIERYAKKKKTKKKKTRGSTEKESASTTARGRVTSDDVAPADDPDDKRSRKKSKPRLPARKSAGEGQAGNPSAPPPDGRTGGPLAEPTERVAFDWEVLKYVAGAVAVAGLVVLIWFSSTRLAATFTDTGSVGANAAGQNKGLSRSPRPKQKKKPTRSESKPAEQATPTPPPDNTTTVAESALEIGRASDRIHLPPWVDELAKPADLASANATPLITLKRGSGATAEAGDLTAVLEQLSDSGGVIRLTGEGPFFLHPVRVGGEGNVVISSEEQQRPLVYCFGDESQRADAVLNKVGGSLKLLGLDIVIEGDTFAAGPDLSVVAASNCDLVVRNCSLSMRGNRPGQAAAFSVEPDETGDASKVLLDRLFLRGDGLAAFDMGASAVDLVAVNSLFACGAAPFVKFGNESIQSADGTEDATKTARQLRLLSCTVCSKTSAFDFAFDRTAGNPPSTEVLVVNSLVSAPDLNARPTLLSLGRWPNVAASDGGAGGPKDLRFLANSSAFLGWETLIDAQAQTIRDVSGWAEWWPEPPEDVEFQSQNWPGSLTDFGSATPNQFDPATASELTIKASDGSRPGCLFNTLKLHSANSLARAVALRARPDWPDLQYEGMVIPVDLEKEDLGRRIGRDDWESGTIFELSGAGYKFSTPIIVQGKSLSLRFVDSTESTLTLSPKQVARGTPFIHVADGSIHIENGSVKIPASKRPTIPAWFLRVTNGSFSLKNCYVRGPMLSSPHFEGLIDWSGGPSPENFGRIEDSYLSSIEASLSTRMQGHPLLIKNSVLVSLADLFSVSGGGSGSASGVIDIQSSTMSSANSFFNIQSTVPQNQASVLRVFVDETVFAPHVVASGGAAQPIVLKLNGSGSPLVLMDWWENRNGYAVEISEYLREGESPASRRRQSFDSAWVNVWGSERVSRPIFGSGDVMLQETLPGPSDVEPGDFRLHSVSTASRWAEDGGPIGADLANVKGGPIRAEPKRDPARRPRSKSSKKRPRTKPKF